MTYKNINNNSISITEMVAERKILKYSALFESTIFQVVAFETFGPMNQSGVDSPSDSE